MPRQTLEESKYLSRKVNSHKAAFSLRTSADPDKMELQFR